MIHHGCLHQPPVIVLHQGPNTEREREHCFSEAWPLKRRSRGYRRGHHEAFLHTASLWFYLNVILSNNQQMSVFTNICRTWLLWALLFNDSSGHKDYTHSGDFVTLRTLIALLSRKSVDWLSQPYSPACGDVTWTVRHNLKVWILSKLRQVYIELWRKLKSSYRSHSRVFHMSSGLEIGLATQGLDLMVLHPHTSTKLCAMEQCFTGKSNLEESS